jgi:tetratricopeptide (TPR) repeat protein
VLFRASPGRIVVLVFACLPAVALLAQPASEPAFDAATTAYEQGKAADAARILGEVLQNHPNDLRALVLMGVVLDGSQRYAEAEPYYLRALKIAPSSPQVLNNAANHYLAVGNRNRARELYLKTVANDPKHVNANLQLAEMSVEDKQGRQALAYLDHVTGGKAPADPSILLLRARALALSGRCRESGELLGKVGEQPGAEPALHLSIGLAQAECKLYGAAEESFSRALDADPRNFEILYNLGLAALRAGHSDRAESALLIALRERPDDPDTLYALAQAFQARDQLVKAAAVLARAEKAAPDRSDLPLLLAQVLARLGFYDDSAEAYSRYLKLKPDDDMARRERGFDFARVHEVKGALHDLEWYVARHPRDAQGYFDLAVAQVFESQEKALALLNKAIELDPGLYQARYTRGLLNIEQGNIAPAIPDLERFLKQRPDDFRALAHLGQAYLAVDRVNDALTVLERAKALAPDSALVLVHYRRALLRLGRKQEAAVVLARLRDSDNRDEHSIRRVGLLDYLSLSPSDQRARYLANLRENSAADPANARLKIGLARELLAEGKKQEGLETLRHLTGASAEPATLAECGKILLDAGEFQDARDTLRRAVTAAPELSEARLDLAIAIFRLHDAEGALRELDKTPPADRKGDYYLLRAQILDAQGKIQEAGAALNEGMRAAPTRATLYYQATSFLLKHKLYHEAQTLLEEASHVLPDDRDLLLAQVVTLDLLRRNPESEKLLGQIQARWPEWERPYLLKGILLEIQLKSAEARQALETAIALGANTPEAYYYEALAITHSAPEDLDAAQHAISQAMALTAKDPYIYLLAGKISLARKDYTSAVEQLLAATRLQPSLVPAHYALRDAYNALGDRQKSMAELEAIKRVSAETGGTGITPFPVEDFLFAVRPPG